MQTSHPSLDDLPFSPSKPWVPSDEGIAARSKTLRDEHQHMKSMTEFMHIRGLYKLDRNPRHRKRGGAPGIRFLYKGIFISCAGKLGASRKTAWSGVDMDGVSLFATAPLLRQCLELIDNDGDVFTGAFQYSDKALEQISTQARIPKEKLWMMVDFCHNAEDRRYTAYRMRWNKLAKKPWTKKIKPEYFLRP